VISKFPVEFFDCGAVCCAGWTGDWGQVLIGVCPAGSWTSFGWVRVVRTVFAFEVIVLELGKNFFSAFFDLFLNRKHI